MRSLNRALAALTGIGLTTSAMAIGVTVYEQVFDPTPVPDLEGAFADGVPGQFYNLQIADNFVLDQGTTINGVSWTGFSENFENADLTNFESFVIKIYADDGTGAPGKVLLDETVLLADANPVLLEAGGSVTGGDLYEFSAKFPPLELGLDLYWLSIGSVNVLPLNDAFVWAASVITDGFILLDEDFTGEWVPPGVDIDMAFALQEGSALPCLPDLDGNGSVGFADLQMLLQAWGECPPGPCPEDLDANGSVGFADLQILLQSWGPCA